MRKFLLAAGVAAVSMAAAAQANAVSFTFVPGAASPSAGYTVIDTFDNADGIVGTNFQIKTPPADGNGAPPANSVPSGTPYLSVLGGGSATIALAKPVEGLEFDWGSIDGYNTLTVFTEGGSATVIPGTTFTNTPANGNQVAAGTNGLFKIFRTDKITGIELSSTTNSFEIDNLAVAVPEPSTWAVMLVGFGGIGAMIRRRRTAAFA
jgi:hypothetical protein